MCERELWVKKNHQRSSLDIKTAGDIESLAVLYVCVSLAKTPVGDFA